MQCYYSSPCVALLLSVASSRPLTYYQTHPIPFFVHDLALLIHEPCIASTGTPPCSARHTPPRVFTSRPLGTAPANHSTLSKSHANSRRHRSRHPATTIINQGHVKKIYRRSFAQAHSAADRRKISGTASCSTCADGVSLPLALPIRPSSLCRKELCGLWSRQSPEDLNNIIINECNPRCNRRPST